MVLLSGRNAEEKLVTFLLLMTRGQVQNRGTVIDLPMTRLDIADYLAMSIETVSRIISRLVDCGGIATAGRSNAVLKTDALIALAGSESKWPSLQEAYSRRRAIA